MRLAIICTCALLATTVAMPARTGPALQGVSPAVSQLLTEIRQADKGQLAVSEEDGRFLRLLVASSGSRQALEIGAASGYSAIWIGLGLRETGGRLTTIEYDPKRAGEARANVARAGLSDIVQVVSGDAFKAIPGIPGEFRVVTNNLSAGTASTWTKLPNPPRTEGHPYNIKVLNDGSVVVTYSGRRNASVMWPSWSEPMVATNATVFDSRRSFREIENIRCLRLMISII